MRRVGPQPIRRLSRHVRAHQFRVLPLYKCDNAVLRAASAAVSVSACWESGCRRALRTSQRTGVALYFSTVAVGRAAVCVVEDGAATGCTGAACAAGPDVRSAT